MRCQFVGVGEAFDDGLPNCAVHVEAFCQGGRRTALLDCGFTAPFAYWRLVADPLDLDLLWISHCHGDHFFGVPALLLRFWEEGRVKPLVVAGQPGVGHIVTQAMDLAYPNLRPRFAYPIEFVEIAPGDTVGVAGFTLACALSDHPCANASLRLTDGLSTLFYSGDGRPTPATQTLAQGADLVIHESFSLEEDTPGHGTVPGSIAFARAAGAPLLALVHLRRDVRRDRGDAVRGLMRQASEAGDLSVLLPEPGDLLELKP
ncbi:MAG: MBL fold metallo-hydrolase [Desulfovibrionaceae bacterium]